MQGKNFFCLAYSSKEVCAERLEPFFVADRGCELGRDENLAAQRLAQGLDPRNFVDRRSDDRKVEAVNDRRQRVALMARMNRTDRATLRK